MRKITQLTVFMENAPGTLASVARALGGVGVNIVDFSAVTVGAAGCVQLIPDDVAKAKDALQKAGFPCIEQNVLYAEVGNAPGTLATLAEKLAAQNINVHSAYATTMLGDKSTSVVLAVSDIEAAAAIV
jgi:hypothetical protein